MASLPPEILAGLVTGGVALVALAARFSGTSRPQVIRDGDHARKLFAVDFPQMQVTDVVVGERGRTALLALHDGHGAVTVLGDHCVARRLGAGDVTRIEERGDTLVLVMADFGAPRLRIRVADATVRARWSRALVEPAREAV